MRLVHLARSSVVYVVLLEVANHNQALPLSNMHNQRMAGRMKLHQENLNLERLRLGQISSRRKSVGRDLLPRRSSREWANFLKNPWENCPPPTSFASVALSFASRNSSRGLGPIQVHHLTRVEETTSTAIPLAAVLEA